MSVVKEFLFGLGWKVDNSGLTEAEKKARASARATADEWKKAGAEITKSLAAVGTIALGAAAGIFKLADSAASAGDRVAKAAKQAGVASGEYQRLSFALKRSGGSAEGLDRSLRTMTLNLENAAQKGTGPLADGLRSVGLSAERLLGLSVEEKMAMISEAMQGVTDGSRRAGIMMQIFGAKGGAELKPLIDGGAASIRALGDEAERLGEVMGVDALAASEEFADSMLDIKTTLKALVRDVGISILPAVKSVIDRVKEWAVANRELIATKAQEFINAVINALESMIPALVQLLPMLLQLVQVAAEMSQAPGPGGATAAMIAFKASMSGALGPAGLLAVAIATIASALVNVAVKAQDARFALDDVLQGGRGKRGEGAKFVASKREGQLAAQRRTMLARARELSGPNAARAALGDGEAFPTTSAGVSALSRKAESLRRAAMARVKGIDASIAQERASAQASFEENAAAPFQGPLPEQGGAGPGARTRTSRGGRGSKPADLSQAEGLFGEDLRRLAQGSGVGDTAIQAALQAGQTSLGQGAAEAVARKAAMSRLGSLAGKDFNTQGSQRDPLLSAILGDENVPDIELSGIARGANPSTLISNITNNVTSEATINIDGAGDPGEVASKAAGLIRTQLDTAMGKASKTAKVAYLR